MQARSPPRADVDAVLLTGGTGIARRDTTVEALAALFDKTLDGFGELFRMLSFAEVGPAAMLSRATAGVVGGVAVFLMPGSPAAVRLAMERLILPELGAHRRPSWVAGRPSAASTMRTHDHPPLNRPRLTGRPLDRPQRRVVSYLRVSVTDRCNYRCTYCLPEDGVSHVDRDDILRFEEIAALVRCFVDLGVRRVRLTGGEPTVRRDLVAAGAHAARHPRPARTSPCPPTATCWPSWRRPLRAAGVDRLNVSLDSLDPERFARITRRGDLARVLAGIEAARAAGFRSIKLNAVAIKGFNDDEVAALCGYAWQRGLVPALHRADADGRRRAVRPGHPAVRGGDPRAWSSAAFPGRPAGARCRRRRAGRRPGPLLAPRGRHGDGAGAPARWWASSRP